MSDPEARFTINVKDGIVELEGKEGFVNKHLEKFEEIFKTAIKEAISKGLEHSGALKALAVPPALPQEALQSRSSGQKNPQQERSSSNSIAARHSPRTVPTIHPIPVDLKAGEGKVGLREFYSEKKPSNHYEKAAVFVYYLTKFNKQHEVRFGEILSCYEEVDEKKPSILDIVKNSVRYKGWLEQGNEKFSARLTISGENFVKFDLPTSATTSQSTLADHARHQSNPI